MFLQSININFFSVASEIIVKLYVMLYIVTVENIVLYDCIFCGNYVDL